MLTKVFFLGAMVKYTYTLFPFEFEMLISSLLRRVWNHKDHHQNCNCSLKSGDCLARKDWCVDRLRQIWKTTYVKFDIAISKIKENDPTFINFDSVCIFEIDDDEFEDLFLIK